MDSFENKSNTSTGKSVAIFILVVLLLSALTYIGYNEYTKILSNKKVEKKVVRKDMYYKEVDEILKQIDMYNYIFSEEYPINDVNQLDNQLKLRFGVYALNSNENIDNYYSEDDLDDIYKNYFSDGFKVIYEDIKCPSKDGVLYTLNNDTKTYVKEEKHEHGTSSIDIDTYYVSDTIKGNQYIIDTNILYSNYCNEVCSPDNSGYYTSYSDAVKGGEPVIYKRNEYNDIKENLPITTFTFIKNKSHYKLKSVQINK